MLFYKTLLYIHIISGFAGLITFWVPAFAKKGGKLHVQAGRWYVRFMWVMVVSAALLCVRNLIIGKMVMGLFLGFIAMITANPLWYAIAVLKEKKGMSQGYLTLQRGFRFLIVLAAVGMLLYGYFVIPDKNAVVLLYIFGGLGFADLPNLIREWRGRGKPRSWFKEHLVGMFTTGIAAFTAFLVFGANNFLGSVLSGYWAVVPWVLPTVLGTYGIIRSIRVWKEKGAIPQEA